MKANSVITPGSPATASSRAAQRKRLGIFYTPEPVAQYLVQSTFNEWRSHKDGLSQLRIIDPACGDGALLWPAYQLLCGRERPPHPAARLQIIQRQLFGVDLDQQAIDSLRQRFRNDLGEDVPEVEVEAVLKRNFRCGNAVDGSGWEPSDMRPEGCDGARFRQSDDTFDWSEQFPDVCAAGGFDLVIANPPYRRERGAKADLDHLARSPLALSHRQARMDLWHYFFHRSLDLLRPGGVLTFIVNSYWTTSRAGQSLVARLQAETTPLEFVLLGTAPIFSGVGGRHLTMRVRKGITTERCRIVTLTGEQQAEVLEPALWHDLAGPSSDGNEQTLTRDDVLDGRRLNLRRMPQPNSPSNRLARSFRTLGDLFEVRQGIAENPPRVTATQARQNSTLRSGEGVFVLTTEELASLQLSADELKLVRPYFSAAEITKNWTVPTPQQWLLYLTRQTAPDLAALPHIRQHLSRFRSLLEQRREAQQGKIAWWHLHWPREARLFEAPRILAIQMANEPRFAYVETPTYVGFSINLIVERPNSIARKPTQPTLEALAAILNSRPAASWFDAHAKHRGVNLDITGSTLKEFPVPEMNAESLHELVRLARQRTELGTTLSEVDAKSIESQIDRLVAANW